MLSCYIVAIVIVCIVAVFVVAVVVAAATTICMYVPKCETMANKYNNKLTEEEEEEKTEDV